MDGTVFKFEPPQPKRPIVTPTQSFSFQPFSFRPPAEEGASLYDNKQLIGSKRSL